MDSPDNSGPLEAAAVESSSDELSLLYEMLGDQERFVSIILVGASALIPVPFLDDWAKSALERRAFRLAAEREGLALTSEELDRLVQEPPSGCCLVGCLGKALLYPIKKLIRKILFFLEIKRAVDQSTNALAENWLFSLALRRGMWQPNGDLAQADMLRGVIERSCTVQGVKPLELAIGSTFRQAKGTLFDFANRFIGKTTPSKDEFTATVELFKQEEAAEILLLTQKMQKELSLVSKSYLQRFAQEFEKELEVAMVAPPEQGSA